MFEDALQMMQAFPIRQWKKSTIINIGKIDKIVSADQAIEQPFSLGANARKHSRIHAIDKLVCSQERQLGASKCPREISQEAGIPCSSMVFFLLSYNFLQLSSTESLLLVGI